MYIGGVGMAGLHHLVWEVVDNSVDEAMNGHATRDHRSRLHKDGHTVTVADNGRGIPVDKHPKTKKPALETVLTVLHAGGKFDGNNYKTAGGLHGVGASVVNALSKQLTAVVRRDGSQYRMTFSKGRATIETAKAERRGPRQRERRSPSRPTRRSFRRPTSTATRFAHDWKRPAFCIAA